MSIAHEVAYQGVSSNALSSEGKVITGLKIELIILMICPEIQVDLVFFFFDALAFALKSRHSFNQYSKFALSL